MVRERSVYSPAGRPGRSTAQCTLARRIGQFLGRPAASKPSVPAGILSPSIVPPQFAGGGRISASTQGALSKYLSSAGQSTLLDETQTCTFDRPDMPTWA